MQDRSLVKDQEREYRNKNKDSDQQTNRFK